MGSSQSKSSKIYTFDNIYSDNIHDLEIEIKDENVVVSYNYTTSFKHYMYGYEKPIKYHREDIIKLTNMEALKMDLYTLTMLNKYDCVKLAEFIWKMMK